MGQEFGQRAEWSEQRGLDWFQLDENGFSNGISRLVNEHQPLLDVLLSGKPSMAGSAFRAHAEKTGRETLERMAKIAA